MKYFGFIILMRSVIFFSESDTKESLDDELEKRSPEKEVNKLAVSLSRHKKISLSGSVSGRQVIVVDDMIDTGHTLKEALAVSTF